MNYYATGDLEAVLKSQRVKETALPECGAAPGRCCGGG